MTDACNDNQQTTSYLCLKCKCSNGQSYYLKKIKTNFKQLKGLKSTHTHKTIFTFTHTHTQRLAYSGFFYLRQKEQQNTKYNTNYSIFNNKDIIDIILTILIYYCTLNNKVTFKLLSHTFVVNDCRVNKYRNIRHYSTIQTLHSHLSPLLLYTDTYLTSSFL